MRGIAILVACSLWLAGTAGAAEQDLPGSLRFRVDHAGYLRQFEPVFKRPIRDGASALPVGNGDLAAVVWQPDHLTVMLNKCDISGGSSQAARLRIETPKKIADRVGTLESRLSLYEATATVTYDGGKLPESAGWMWRSTLGHWLWKNAPLWESQPDAFIGLVRQHYADPAPPLPLKDWGKPISGSVGTYGVSMNQEDIDMLNQVIEVISLLDEPRD